MAIDLYLTKLIAKFECIGKEVEEHLLHPLFVCLDPNLAIEAV